MKLTLHTGGATGADWVWATEAMRQGVAVVIHSFHGHNRHTPPQTELITYNYSQLLESDPTLRQAAKLLDRPFPTSNNYVNSLLRRNVPIITRSDLILAVGPIIQTNPHLVVGGGTGWGIATAMALGIPYQIWDTTTQEWVCSAGSDIKPIHFAGIGSRTLPPLATSVIREKIGIMTIRE